MNTMTGLKNNLLKMNGKRSRSQQALPKNEHIIQREECEFEQGIEEGSKNCWIERNNDVKDKLYIVNTLLGINGSMKQFSNNLKK